MTALDVNPAGWCDGHQLAVRGTVPTPSPAELIQKPPAAEVIPQSLSDEAIPKSPPAALRSRRAGKGGLGTLLCALVLLGGIPALFTVLCNVADQQLGHLPARHTPADQRQAPPNGFRVHIVGAYWLPR